MIQGEAIAALATARGQGAIGLIRISGEGSIKKAASVFRGKVPLEEMPSRSVVLGWICNPETGERIDQVLITVFRAPSSYTGEDMVEIHCHGGTHVCAAVLDVLWKAGCRLSKAGEFTQRAYLNGKMSLIQAEAVAGIINARTAEQRRIAIFQMDGEKESKIRGIKEEMEEWLMRLEAAIEFPEDEGAPEFARREFCAGWESLLDRIAAELELREKARRIRDGILVPIVGCPNAGKSTMFNWFVKSERVIVDAAPGTTRDAVEEELEVCGVAVRLVDTAGIRVTEDRVEQQGIAKTWELIKRADLVLWVHDITGGEDSEESRWLSEFQGLPIVHIYNKSDLGSGTGLCVSFREKMGLEKLCLEIEGAIKRSSASVSGVPVSHVETECLRGAAKCGRYILEKASSGGFSEEVMAEDVKECLANFDLLAGICSREEILNGIFSRFCIGK